MLSTDGRHLSWINRIGRTQEGAGEGQGRRYTGILEGEESNMMDLSGSRATTYAQQWSGSCLIHSSVKLFVQVKAPGIENKAACGV